MEAEFGELQSATDALGEPGGKLDLGRRRERRIASLERDLQNDRRRHDRMLARYEVLREELEELTSAIGRRQRFVDALKELSPSAEADRRPASVPDTKPQIAEQILFASLEPLFPRQVRDVAVDKCWLPADAASANQLSVAMSKMARKGRLVKGNDGRYTLPGRA